MTTKSVARPSRNEPCPCGSGRKYKHCCLEKDDKKAAAMRAKAAVETPAQAATEVPPAATRAPKHKTDQPWKAGSATRGFVPRSRTPRKVGGG